MPFLDDVLAVLRRWTLGDGWLATLEVALAAAIIYVLALWIARTGKKRFLGRNTVFDVLLAFILGSVLSRAINGQAAIGPTAVAGFVLVLMHYMFGSWAENSERMGRMVKGRGEAVVEDGEIVQKNMDEHHLTRRDLEEAARLAGIRNIDEIELAYFERNGQISIVPKSLARVIEVDVKEGVQTVRIEIER